MAYYYSTLNSFELFWVQLHSEKDLRRYLMKLWVENVLSHLNKFLKGKIMLIDKYILSRNERLSRYTNQNIRISSELKSMFIIQK